MKVKVQYFASVRELVNLREEIMDIPAESNVAKFLDLLAAKHGSGLREYIFDAAGKPRSYLQFLIDEKSFSETAGLSTVLKDGCTFAIIPPVGGG